MTFDVVLAAADQTRSLTPSQQAWALVLVLTVGIIGLLTLMVLTLARWSRRGRQPLLQPKADDADLSPWQIAGHRADPVPSSGERPGENPEEPEAGVPQR